MNLQEIAKEIHEAKENIILVYGFNSTGKTMLSVAYKDLTKNEDGTHAGVYFNAYSEDIFTWDNDDESNNVNMRLLIRPSSLSKYHSLLNEANLTIEANGLEPQQLGPLVVMVEAGQINARSGKEVLSAIFQQGGSPRQMVESRGLAQIADLETLGTLIAEILQANPEQVQQYLQGKKTLQQWFFGQVMAKSRGRANPEILQQLLHEQLASLE
mgnify:CR=1 FL=1